MKKTIGIIGLGSIGARHHENLKAMGHDVIGHDPNPTKINYIHNDVEEIIKHSDAIIIASPTPRHYFDICACIGEGPKLFVEKPIADRLFDIDGVASLITMIGYNLRFHSCVKKAKEWLDEGRIGKPIWANFTLGQYSEKPPYLRDGVILNWSHELDLACYLIGPAVVAGSSTRLTDGKDDISDILLTHESGCRSTVHLDYITKNERRFFTITGERGHISVDLKSRSSRLIIDGEKPDIRVGYDTWNDNYIEEMQEFIAKIDDPKIKGIGCTGAEGLEVLKICLEVRKQAGLG